MSPEHLLSFARELFAICAAAAAMELLVQGRRPDPAFRTVCAVAATVCALRAVARLIS